MLPYKDNWYTFIDNKWIITNHSYIEHLFLEIWLDVYEKLGVEGTDNFDIEGFSKFMFSKIKVKKIKSEFI